MNSVISFPERGPWGKSSWRGNTSGYVIKELVEHFNPSLFVDVCEGSGTSGDVCRQLNIPYVGLDLHKGFDFTKDSVLNKLERPADVVFSHPPYHSMIDYVAERKKHGLTGSQRDLSTCQSVEEFLELAQVMLLNQREATRAGGVYTSLIGDMRKDGKFHSFQSDFIKMMPTSELHSVTIKLQHNMVSGNRNYNGKFIPILHEYLLIWKRSSLTLAQVAWQNASEMKSAINSTWKNFVKMALINLGGQARLDDVYQEVERVAGSKVSSNPSYKAKIRQTLQYHFTNIERGKWAVAA